MTIKLGSPAEQPGNGGATTVKLANVSANANINYVKGSATAKYTQNQHERLVAEIKAKRQSGYLYDSSPANGGYRWYEQGNSFTGFRYYMGAY